MKITDFSKILECFQKEFSLSIPLPKPILENNKQVIVDKNAAYGFIIGDSSLIPKKNFWYIEVKSTKIYTILSALIHLSSIAEPGYYYVHCGSSGHSKLNYHVRLKSVDPNLTILHNIKKNKRINLLNKLLTPKLLAGLFDSDGSVSININTLHYKIVFISKEYDLLRTISKYMTSSLGISTSKNPTKIKPHKSKLSSGITINKTTTWQIYTTNKKATIQLVKIILPYTNHIIRRLELTLLIKLSERSITKEEFRTYLKTLRQIQNMTKAENYTKETCITTLDKLYRCLNT